MCGVGEGGLIRSSSIQIQHDSHDWIKDSNGNVRGLLMLHGNKCVFVCICQGMCVWVYMRLGGCVSLWCACGSMNVECILR